MFDVGMISSFFQLVFLIIILVGVLFLSYIVTKKLALFRQGSFSNKNMKIIEVMQLSPGQYLYIVEIAKHHYLFSSTKERLEYCMEIDSKDLEIQSIEHPSFDTYLKKFALNKQEKKDDKK